MQWEAFFFIVPKIFLAIIPDSDRESSPFNYLDSPVPDKSGFTLRFNKPEDESLCCCLEREPVKALSLIPLIASGLWGTVRIKNKYLSEVRRQVRNDIEGFLGIAGQPPTHVVFNKEVSSRDII